MIEPMLSAVNLKPFFLDYPNVIESVSVGGESGPNARACDYSWVMGVHLQCVENGVAFSYHQTGARLIKGGKEYSIEAVRVRDHVLIRIGDGRRKTEVTVALPDSSRYAFIALTGRNCFINDIHIDKTSDAVQDNYIPRIAEEISYIDVPAGDIPNLQVDGVRTASTQGVPVEDGMSFSFHAMSLPTARLIWHCPYVVLFYAADGKVNGPDYREYALIRLNGEDWTREDNAPNHITVRREDDFMGWEAWKQGNKQGYDCTVAFAREGDRITVSTRNLGLSVTGVISLPDPLPKGKETVYAALTGDQCALTGIRVSGARNV